MELENSVESNLLRIHSRNEILNRLGISTSETLEIEVSKIPILVSL